MDSTRAAGPLTVNDKEGLMTSGNRKQWWQSACVAGALAVGMAAFSAAAATPGPTDAPQAAAPGSGPAPASPPLRVAERSDIVKSAQARLATSQLKNEHPLAPALRWANEGLVGLQNIRDYSTTLVKRERIGSKLNEYEYMFLKIRHKPFSVYMYFLGPSSLKGREVIYIEGKNNGNMWAHTTGVQDTMFGTLSLKPNGFVAMQDERYPLTEIGLLNLVRRLVEVAEKDMKYGECEVKFYPGAKINKRVCTCIEVTHPVPRKNFLFHLARIFVDQELNVPIRYESYDWPKTAGAKPELLEEYTYLNLKLNQGFTDGDFDIHNSNYRFR
jgi:hypothetical protein